MDVTLDAEMSRFVNDKISSGQCASASELINDALSLMKDQEQWTPEDIVAWRREIAHGLAQLDRGEGVPLDIEAIKARVGLSAQAQQKAG